MLLRLRVKPHTQREEPLAGSGSYSIPALHGFTKVLAGCLTVDVVTETEPRPMGCHALCTGGGVRSPQGLLHDQPCGRPGGGSQFQKTTLNDVHGPTGSAWLITGYEGTVSLGSGIGVYAVPESSRAVLALAGLVRLVGLVLRRRRSVGVSSHL